MDKTETLKKITDSLSDNETALIYTPVNRRYVTGFVSSLGYLLINKKSQMLLMDGRYFEAATNSVKNVPVVLLSDLKEQIAGFVNETETEKLLIEDEIEVGTAATLERLSGCKTYSDKISPLLIRLRSYKNGEEFKKIIKAQRIAEKAFNELLNVIKPGVTEKRLACELEYKMRIMGADNVSFDSVVVSGKNSSLPHGVPTDKSVEKGNFITFDFGALVDGYHSDMTRTVAVGYATDEMIKVYNIVLEAQICGCNAAKEGTACKDVDFAARSIIEKAGYGEYYKHSTGHGVGLQIHEYPNLSHKSGEKLQIGYAVTCEPGIYLPDKFGVRIEDTLFITENGTENITNFEKKLIIV